MINKNYWWWLCAFSVGLYIIYNNNVFIMVGGFSLGILKPLVFGVKTND